MPWKPRAGEEYPSLGWAVIDWMSAMLAAPDRADYEPFVPYLEQEDFLVAWYRIDPATGKFKHHRGVLCRPRGWGKSPLLAAICAAEALGPVVFDGWDAKGRPVGKPWSTIRTPVVQCAAISEFQTRNTWVPLTEMLREDAPVAAAHPGLEPFGSFINLPGTGRIEQVTSSANSIKGSRPVLGIQDQTEAWVPSNGGVRLAGVMRANAAKIGGRTLESPNAYIPGEGSVAERSAEYWSAICEGRAKDDGLLYDHREAPGSTDMAERDSLIAGLRVAYGDSSAHSGGCVIHDPPCAPGHVDLDRLVSTIWDPAQDPQQSRSDFLNQVTHSSDAWISSPQWDAISRPGERPAPGEAVVLGFDGSRGRARGNADATALIGCRVVDGLLFQVGVWQAPAGPAGKEWAPDPAEVEHELKLCFERYRVVGVYADPSGWSEHVARWESLHGRRLRVAATRSNPMSCWPRGKHQSAVDAVERLRQAVAAGSVTHDGSPALRSHVLNARRRNTRGGYLLYKAFPNSPDKIDAAYAAVLAWAARLDAVAAGLGGKREQRRATLL